MLDDLRLFDGVALAGSFTGAAARLGVPKQTLSRRIAALEARLGVRLLLRTTRRLTLTDAGVTYARRAAEIVRLAAEADRAASDQLDVPSGTLRITADPLFGDAFVPALVIELARRYPDLRVEATFMRRRAELAAEGFDAAFRIGRVDEPDLRAIRLGPARIRYCASPSYIARRGRPTRAEALSKHELVVVGSDEAPIRWPIRSRKGVELITVAGRIRTTSSHVAHEAVRAGLGIGLFADFACADDLRRGRFVSVLDPRGVDVGAVWLVHPAARPLSARLRVFLELAIARLGGAPWDVSPKTRRRSVRTSGA